MQWSQQQARTCAHTLASAAPYPPEFSILLLLLLQPYTLTHCRSQAHTLPTPSHTRITMKWISPRRMHALRHPPPSLTHDPLANVHPQLQMGKQVKLLPAAWTADAGMHAVVPAQHQHHMYHGHGELHARPGHYVSHAERLRHPAHYHTQSTEPGARE